ncbi:MAG: HD domain-containing phosphohydrolase [Candidatus Aceula meridiana]|nr:HD domain-containing phosphohydrolase [Candidatus Aceula meridiana]
MTKDLHQLLPSLDSKTADCLGIGIFQYRLSPAERFLKANQSCVRLAGCAIKTELFKIKIRQLFSNPEDYRRWTQLLKDQQRIKLFKIAIKGKNKKAVWVAISACVVQNGKKEKYLHGVMQDISASQKEQERVIQEMDFLQSFLDQMPDAIYFKDRRSHITRVNKFYAKGFRLKPGQIIGKTDFDFFPKAQAKKMLDDDKKVIRSKIPIVGKIERTLLPNGTWNQVITTKVPIFDRQGEVVGTMGITRDMTEHANFEKERFNMLMNALTVLNKALELRDPYTFSHARDVGRIAKIIGKELGFDEDRLIKLKLAADLHDLGKISVPLDILIKPGKLTSLEYSLIQEHVQRCHDLIDEMKFPFKLSDIIYQHHERLDGSGYPNKLKGKEIMLEARILAMSDVLESMTSHRPYRAALGIKKAIAELKKGSGRKYDSKIVKIALGLIKKNHGNPFWLNY